MYMYTYIAYSPYWPHLMNAFNTFTFDQSYVWRCLLEKDGVCLVCLGCQRYWKVAGHSKWMLGTWWLWPEWWSLQGSLWNWIRSGNCWCLGCSRMSWRLLVANIILLICLSKHVRGNLKSGTWSSFPPWKCLWFHQHQPYSPTNSWSSARKWAPAIRSLTMSKWTDGQQRSGLKKTKQRGNHSFCTLMIGGLDPMNWSWAVQVLTQAIWWESNTNGFFGEDQLFRHQQTHLQ